MWLVYLRFVDQDQIVAMHIRTNNKIGVQQIIEMASKHGYTPTARLVDHASFYASGTIKFGVSGLHYQQHHEFENRWTLADSTKT